MNSLTVNDKNITNMIYEIRGKQVMLDSDLAILYECKNGTKSINLAVKRNVDKFPNDFYFQLDLEEFKKLRFHFETANYNMIRMLPYVFTEEGVAMLASVLRTKVANEVSVGIMRSFVMMRKYISNELIEQKFINKQVLKNTEDIKLLQEDAYSKILDIIKEAKKELIIIDNYADKSMLDMIRKVTINVTIICKENCLLKEIDIEKYKEQYNNLKVIYNNTFHDRYIILDKKVIYHCGTSLNHIGSKTFSINKLEDEELKKEFIQKIIKRFNL